MVGETTTMEVWFSKKAFSSIEPAMKAVPAQDSNKLPPHIIQSLERIDTDKEWGFRYHILFLKPGTNKTPILSFMAKRRGTLKEETIIIPPKPITVQSLLPKGDQRRYETFSDILPSLSKPWDWIGVVLALLVLALLLMLRKKIYRLIVRSPRQTKKSLAIDPLQRLWQEIEAIKERVGKEPQAGLLEKLDHALHAYFDAVINMPTRPLLPREIVQRKAGLQGLAQTLDQIEHFKYANKVMGESDFRKTLQHIEDYFRSHVDI